MTLVYINLCFVIHQNRNILAISVDYTLISHVIKLDMVG